MSQEKLQTMIMQNFGGLKRCIMGFVQEENKNTIDSTLCPIPNKCSLLNYPLTKLHVTW